MILVTIGMALREIRRNALRSGLTMLGVIIGVTAVVAMVTLGQSATAKVTSEISSLGNNLLIVSPGAERRGPTTTTATPFDAKDVRAVERLVGTEALVAPTAETSALVVHGSQNEPTTVEGVTTAFLNVRGYRVAKGTWLTDAERSECVLGQTVATELFGEIDPVGDTVRFEGVSCRVVGVLAAKGSSGFGPDPDNLVLMPLTAFQRRVAGNDDVGSILLSVRSADRLDRVASQVKGLLHDRRQIGTNEEDDFSIRDMREIANTVGTATRILTVFLGAVGSVSLLVGGIGIMNIMLVSVTERTREIGVRLAVGALASDIRQQFLVESVVLSLLGGAVGVVFGLLGSWVATWALSLAWSPSPLVVLGSFAFCGGVGIVFGWLPAQRASRLDPIEALRYE